MSRVLDSDPVTSLSPAPDPRVERETDFDLVRRVVSGSEAAWHEFLAHYSGLIFSVINRYLHSKENDDSRAVYVNVIDHLYHTKLATYEGRSTLATWLVLVTRTETLDFLRHRFGRHQVPSGIKRLPAIDQEVYRLYYVEGLPLHEVRAQLEQTGSAITLDGLLAALRRIDHRITDRTLKRLSYDLHAQSVGAASGRLLEFLDHVRTEFENHPGGHSPDYLQTEKEARRVLESVRQLIAELPSEERAALMLRYEKGWSARRISEELGIGSPRRIYTLLARLVRDIRTALYSDRADGNKPRAKRDAPPFGKTRRASVKK
jgi:DNA-directed RNA polymerase specialized sigma24 family protein